MISPKRFLLVSGDFGKTGGMDQANYSLAVFLARQGFDVHTVAHSVDPSLAGLANVTWRRVPRPRHSTILGEPLLRRAGQRMWRNLGGEKDGARAVVNGGNCPLPDINWFHYVHSAVQPMTGSGPLRRAKIRYAHSRFVKSETSALRRARLILANSERTKSDLISYCGADPARVRTVYCGVDPDQFYPASNEERKAARLRLGLDPQKYLVVFVGALGDRRKGFDTLLEAWGALSPRVSEAAQLLVIGTGSEQKAWEKRANRLAGGDSVRFLGFRKDVPEILRASNALVSPTRYEPFGLAVLEALCCGLPAIVTGDAGVAELYPATIRPLLLAKADDTAALAEKLDDLVIHAEQWRDKLRPVSSNLRSHTWDDMARQIFQTVLATSSGYA
jgi:glycosyltransferase involved in cell wall biosynthesis